MRRPPRPPVSKSGSEAVNFPGNGNQRWFDIHTNEEVNARGTVNVNVIYDHIPGKCWSRATEQSQLDLRLLCSVHGNFRLSDTSQFVALYLPACPDNGFVKNFKNNPSLNVAQINANE